MLKTSPFRALKMTALILATLCVELLGLRIFFHNVLHLHIGWKLATDFDFVAPGFFSLALYFFTLFKLSPLPPKRQKAALFFHAAAVTLFVVFSILGRAELSQGAVRGIWFGLLAVVVLSSLHALCPLGYFLKHEKRFFIIPCALAAFSVVFAQNIPDALWAKFIHAGGNFTCNSIAGLVPNTFCTLPTPRAGAEPTMRFITPFLAFDVGKGCGGFDGLALFGAFLFTWMIFFSSAINLFSFCVTFILGSLYAILLNFVRIAMVLNFSTLLNTLWGARTAFIWGSLFFHAQIGWILYLTGFIAFFYVMSPPKEIEEVSRASLEMAMKNASDSGMLSN